jgi:hypothetical protein
MDDDDDNNNDNNNNHELLKPKLKTPTNFHEQKNHETSNKNNL